MNNSIQTIWDELKALDHIVSQNLKLAKVQTRPGASNGLWCCFLLPLVLLIACVRYPVSPLYQLTLVVALGLLLSSLLFISFLSVSSNALTGSHGESLASGAVATLVCVWVLDQGMIFSLALCIPSIYAYKTGVVYALTAMPLCFTIGEAMLIMQGLALFSVATLGNVVLGDTPKTDADIIVLVVQTGLLTVSVMVALASRLRRPEQAGTLLGCLAGALLILLLYLHATLGRSSVLWLLGFITHPKRLALITLWAALVCLCGALVWSSVRVGQKATSAGRKAFHAAAVAVLLPGILADEELITLAAGVAFAALLLVEALRKAKIEPISAILQDGFDIYSDEKDCGGFSLTPIYLLAGVSCPLALVPMHPGRRLQLLSGVLSTGVGDAAASWLGSRYGRQRWTGSQRTVEGTLANILSQFITVYALHICGLLPGEHVLRSAAVAALVSGAVETNTDQVDNLILPLVTLISLMLC